jgi:hypothetical protein
MHLPVTQPPKLCQPQAQKDLESKERWSLIYLLLQGQKKAYNHYPKQAPIFSVYSTPHPPFSSLGTDL